VHESAILTGIWPISSLKVLLGYWPFVTTLLGNSYFFVLATTVLAFVLIGACLLVKYIPHVINDLSIGTNNDLPPLGLKLWVALIFAVPVFFDAGLLWFVLWWFVALWGYLNIMERRIALVFISLIFMSSWVSHIGAGFLTYSQTNMNQQIFSLDHTVGSPKDSIEIASWVKNNAADAEPMNIQAVTEIEKKNYRAAVSLLSRALDLEPNNNRYYNHLGIALAGMKRDHEAVKAFQNATTLDPGNAVYHYNISRLHQATYNLYGAEQSIQKASAIDPARVRYFLDQEEKFKDYSFIKEYVPLRRQLARQMKPSDELTATADALWHSALGIFDRGQAIYISLGTFLILFLLGHIPEEKFTKRCNRCGNLYYAGKTSQSGYPMCLQCHWLETKAKKQKNSVLTNKAEEIKQYRIESASYTQKLELILPGMGSFAANRTLKGILRLIIFSGGLVLIATGSRFIHSFIPIGIDISVFMRALGVIALGLLYLRSYKSPPLKYGV
jgi:tetratricopeptide (TPR) repeat protein